MKPVPTLSVVVPAYNEEALLEESLRRLHACLRSLAVSFEIVLVDDGSTDRTPQIADRLAASLEELHVLHQRNQGIGGAFRSGAALSAGEYLVLWPVDMPSDPEDWTPYLDALGEADVIVGCRRARLGYTPLMRLNSWLYVRLVSLLFGLRLRDVNWIHLYRRSALLRVRLTQKGIPMLAEALVRLRDQGARIREVDVSMKVREGGVASASRLRVMRRTLVGLFAFWNQWRLESVASHASDPLPGAVSGPSAAH